MIKNGDTYYISLPTAFLGGLAILLLGIVWGDSKASSELTMSIQRNAQKIELLSESNAVMQNRVENIETNLILFREDFKKWADEHR